MPSLTKLLRLGTLPETRHAISAAARSPSTRELVRRAVNDRAALAREMRQPATLRDLLLEAVRHPATRELGGVGLFFLPGRYLGVGWAAGWAVRRLSGSLEAAQTRSGTGRTGSIWGSAKQVPPSRLQMMSRAARSGRETAATPRLGRSIGLLRRRAQPQERRSKGR